VNEAITNLMDVDRLIHEPARLMIILVLATAKEADFLYLRTVTKLTKGNLSVHLSRLEEAGYIQIEKSIVGKTTRTVCQITPAGTAALTSYREQMTAAIQPNS